MIIVATAMASKKGVRHPGCEGEKSCIEDGVLESLSLGTSQLILCITYLEL